jgi:hypothetical protein
MQALWIAARATILILTGGGGRFYPPVNLAVCVDSVALAASEMTSAQSSAAAMLAGIGIQVRWAEAPSACSIAPIRIRVVDWLVNRPPDEMAYARPFAIGAKLIVVEYEHIKRTAARARGLEPKLLAHVLVHELVHVLTGGAGHSRAGVMKAHWGPADCQEMLRGSLPFTAADAVLARAGAERLAATVTAP